MFKQVISTLAFALALMVLLAVACGAEASPTPTPIPEPTATHTPVTTPTHTPVPTPTHTPVPTPIHATVPTPTFLRCEPDVGQNLDFFKAEPRSYNLVHESLLVAWRFTKAEGRQRRGLHCMWTLLY